MNGFLLLLAFIAIMAIISGMIEPKSVIRWGKNRTRSQVIIVYGLLLLFFISASIININYKYSEIDNKNLIITNESDYKKSAKPISYGDLLRESEKNKNIVVHMKGRVVQKFGARYRVATEPQGYGRYFDDVVFVSYDKLNLIEDDIIEFYGDFEGLETYTAVLGNEITIPSIDAKYLTILQKRK